MPLNWRNEANMTESNSLDHPTLTTTNKLYLRWWVKVLGYVESLCIIMVKNTFPWHKHELSQTRSWRPGLSITKPRGRTSNQLKIATLLERGRKPLRFSRAREAVTRRRRRHGNWRPSSPQWPRRAALWLNADAKTFDTLQSRKQWR